MRKITGTFSGVAKVRKFKKIIRKVYSGDNDNIPEIVNFSLNKNLIPKQVERVELEIKKAIGSNITISIPKTSLTFLAGQQHPYSKVASDLEDEARYIVLPWNIGSAAGLEHLRNLIDQIPFTATGIKYTIYINDAAGSRSEVGALAELSVSRSHVQDETEQLLEHIERLEVRLRDLTGQLEEVRAAAERKQTALSPGSRNVSLTKMTSDEIVLECNGYVGKITFSKNQEQGGVTLGIG